MRPESGGAESGAPHAGLERAYAPGSDSTHRTPNDPTTQRPNDAAGCLTQYATRNTQYLLVLLALALRLWGIGWSLPNERHYFSYHPDEGVNLVRGVLDHGVARPHVALGFYDYGGFYFYLWQGAVAVNGSYRIVRQPPTPADGAPAPSASATIGSMLLVGRLLTAGLGGLTAWLVYALGLRLYGRAAGLVAALVFAVMPAAVVHAHYATVDVPATFVVAAALLIGSRLIRAPDEAAAVQTAEPSAWRWRGVAAAGFVCGLAAATKYNCGLVVLSPVAAIWLRRHQTPNTEHRTPNTEHRTPNTEHRTPNTERRTPNTENRTRTLPYSHTPTLATVVILLAAALGFLVGCPGILAEPQAFWRDFSFELGKSGQGMGLLFVHTGNGWLYHLTSSLRFGLGVPLLTTALTAVAVAFARRSRADLFLLAFLVPYYLLIGYAQVRFLRYVIPMFPALAVLIGRLAVAPFARPAGSAGASRIPDGTARPRRAAELAMRTAVGCAVAVTLLISLALDRLMTRVPAQDQAYDYIQRVVPHGATIGFATAPWYYSPPLSPWFTAPSTGPQRLRAAHDVTEWTLKLPPPGTEWDPSVLQPLPNQFVLSDVESEDARRIDWMPARPLLDALAAGYSAASFQSTPSIFGIDFGKPAYVPNDWLYIYPRVTVYSRK